MVEAEFDYVIVGSGPAGCVLANRLTEDRSTRVLLLEAGGPDRRPEIRVPAAFSRLFRTACDWQFTTGEQTAMAGRELYWPRGKALGGCTSINGQMYVRGHPLDYDAWERLGNSGWGSGEALRLFRRLERYGDGDPRVHGRRGPVRIERLRDPNPGTEAFLRAAAEAGIPVVDDVNGDAQDGATMTRVTQRRGRRWSAADAYLRPALKRPNLEVRTGARALRLVIQGRRARGVEIDQEPLTDPGTSAPLVDADLERHFSRVDADPFGTREVVLARREIILSAGAVGSPHILMLSGIGPQQHLRDLAIPVVRHLPGVGRNLLDHLVATVVVASRTPVSLVGAGSLLDRLRFLLLGKGMLTSNVGEAIALVRTRTGLPAPDLELIFAPAPYVEHGFVRPTRHGFTIGAVALQPRSVGSIQLRSASPCDPPRIDPEYLTDPGGEDLRVLREGVKLARRIFATRAFARLAGDEMDPGPAVVTEEEIHESIRRRAETLYHPVGTCRMGVDALAVVDPELRVRGVDGLRVVDASVMPTQVRGHTMAPTFLIAEKAAELIRLNGSSGRPVPAVSASSASGSSFGSVVSSG